MGVAFAENLFTLFLFYELLTISTYPLVTHAGTTEARQGGRTYLGILLGTSMGLLLVAVIWTWHIAGTVTGLHGRNDSSFCKSGDIFITDHLGMFNAPAMVFPILHGF